MLFVGQVFDDLLEASAEAGAIDRIDIGQLESQLQLIHCELQIADLRELLAESSVRMQEIAYVQETRAVSWAWPGAGEVGRGRSDRSI